jgi:hypothetical protein
MLSRENSLWSDYFLDTQDTHIMIFYFQIESIWKRSKVKDLSIGNVALIPNQMATTEPIKK